MNEFDVPVEELIEDIRVNVVDIEDFNERVVGAYNNGTAEKGLDADDGVARSIIPAATGAFRDFSYIAPDIPQFITENCVGCMDCVTECPDTAILGKVAEPAALEERLSEIEDEEVRATMAQQWGITNKYYNVIEKKTPGAGGKFGIFIDPTKCKGCAECVDACGDHNALKMIPKDDQNMGWYKAAFQLYRSRAPHDAGGNRLRIRKGEHRHRGSHRLQYGVHVHLSLQSISSGVDQLVV